MSSKGEYEKRKALLLSQIQQQRLDLSASCRDWLETTGAYDRGWNTVLSLHSWALVGSSIMATWTIRHPNMLVRWEKRSLCIWSAWSMVTPPSSTATPRLTYFYGIAPSSHHPLIPDSTMFSDIFISSPIS